MRLPLSKIALVMHVPKKTLQNFASRHRDRFPRRTGRGKYNVGQVCDFYFQEKEKDNRRRRLNAKQRFQQNTDGGIRKQLANLLKEKQQLADRCQILEQAIAKNQGQTQPLIAEAQRLKSEVAAVKQKHAQCQASLTDASNRCGELQLLMIKIAGDCVDKQDRLNAYREFRKYLERHSAPASTYNSGGGV